MSAGGNEVLSVGQGREITPFPSSHPQLLTSPPSPHVTLLSPADLGPLSAHIRNRHEIAPFPQRGALPGLLALQTLIELADGGGGDARKAGGGLDLRGGMCVCVWGGGV